MSDDGESSASVPARSLREGAAYLAEHEGRLAWIMGSSRSGSTWLLRMLESLDGVVGIDDPHLGHHLGVWRPQPIAWTVAAERPQLTTLAEIKRHEDDFFFSDRHRDAWMPPVRDLIRRRFAVNAAPALQRDPRVVVKEPGSQAAGMLIDLFPRSRLIFLLRDGRDVVDSWLDAYRQGSWAIAGGAFPVAAAGRAALASWLGSVWTYRTRAVADAFRRIAPKHRVLVRYEDLLQDPAAQLARVAETLEIDVDGERLARIVDEHAYGLVAASRRGALHAVRSAEPGLWRHRSPAERRAMMDAMGDELAAWGYVEAQSEAGTAGRRAAAS